MQQIASRNIVTERVLSFILSLPWIEISGHIIRLLRHIWRGQADEGLYQVLEYHARLEILDSKGKKATFSKKQRVRYQQNHTLAYQDQAWGDGEILLNYQCSPGVVADRYKHGFKTHILISLREEKHKGDEDTFFINWDVTCGFPDSTEHHEIAIDHRTNLVQAEVILPAKRPPTRALVLERLSRRKTVLDEKGVHQLPDGRWRIFWESAKPRLNEHYILEWDW